MTLEEVIKLQADKGLKNTHFVYIHEGGFRIAHTDHERYMADRWPASLPLEDCPLHQWLDWQPDQPVPTGVYMAEGNDDDESWAFEKVSND